MKRLAELLLKAVTLVFPGEALEYLCEGIYTGGREQQNQPADDIRKFV